MHALQCAHSTCAVYTIINTCIDHQSSIHLFTQVISLDAFPQLAYAYRQLFLTRSNLRVICWPKGHFNKPTVTCMPCSTQMCQLQRGCSFHSQCGRGNLTCHQASHAIPIFLAMCLLQGGGLLSTSQFNWSGLSTVSLVLVLPRSKINQVDP